MRFIKLPDSVRERLRYLYIAGAVALVQSPVAAQEQLAKFEPPDGSIYHGYCASNYWTDEGLQGVVQELEDNVTDKPFALWSFFVHAKKDGKWNGWRWREEGPNGDVVHGSGKYLERIRDAGYTPVMSWTWLDWVLPHESPTLQGVVEGEYDWYLDEWIEGIKEFGTPVFIRLSHEMDGYWYPYSEGYWDDPTRNTAEDYVAYWQYIVDRFEAAGVDNVAWVWCVSGGRPAAKGVPGVRDWVDYYPGDAYVDWIAVDVYSNHVGGDILKDLQATMGTDKPIMIPEGGTEDALTQYNQYFSGNNEWVENFYDTILYDMNDQVKAVSWFHWNDDSYVHRDASQAELYKSYIERPEFISELYLPEENPEPVAAIILPDEDIRIPAMEPETLSIETIGFEGQIGGNWKIHSGEDDGLVIVANGNTAIVEGETIGDYVIKVELWDGDDYDSAYLDISITASDGEIDDGDLPDPPAEPEEPAGPTIQSGAEELTLVVGETTTIELDVIGFGNDYGGRWSIESGGTYGLALVDNLSYASIQAVEVGTYLLKAQIWNGADYDSLHFEINVTANANGDEVQPEILGPTEVWIYADSTEFVLETEFVGFTPKGHKWSVVQGSADGLLLIGNGEIAYLATGQSGSYLVKVEAWKNDIHVSKHIWVNAD